MRLRTARAPVHILVLVCVLVVTFISGGATCSKRQAIAEFAPPRIFDAQPTLPDIVAQVNHSLALRRLESSTLSISSPDIAVKLRGQMTWERPHNFNLQAYPGSRMLGTALAAGSNSQMFWLQTQMPSPPTFYYASHDGFENQEGPRRILPVSPLWLREALGVIELDPALQHEGPIFRADGKMEIRTYIPSPRGAYRRHIVLDTTTSVIEQTLLYNHLGTLVATAVQSEHQYYSAIDSSLPHRVEIRLQPEEGPALAFTVEVGFYLLNETPLPNANEFQPPDTTGLSTVDLVQANLSMAQAAATPPAYTQAQPYGSSGSTNALPSAMGRFRDQLR